ncbi:hypothetical protein OPKNFCMD_5478 [Methylobacterium crusticola]|uniref:Uncharacterized protein n=1 Tax=Methylobacterium crusticola TaxID=1697972 RepID=A0ABQ4R5I3_9HYPH|nr:hypothetical protein [Methylobacterium crusticola]GJD52712.1 hypothetical protein OPKNFCMD_5478 [Methylobacterium crusticola]
MNVGDLRAQGETTAAVFCNGLDCQHHAVIATERFPDHLPFPALARRLVCSVCGARDPRVMRDMLAHYDRLYREQGWGGQLAGPLPAHYRVVGRDVPWPDQEEAPQK